MKTIFLVFLAVTCLSAHFVYANDVAKEQAAAAKKSEAPKPKPSKVQLTAEEKAQKKLKQCEETIKKADEDCEKECPPGYAFRFESDLSDCSFNCKYTALNVTETKPRKATKVVAKKRKTNNKPGVKKTKKVVKRRRSESERECNGLKKFSFQNCQLKITGLFAFGEKTKNFDDKFEKLLAESNKKTKPSAKKNKKKATTKKTKAGKKARNLGAARKSRKLEE
jgi:hypothetical protein